MKISRNQTDRHPEYARFLSSRGFAKVAEQFGWSVSGIVVAHSLAGDSGIILFNIAMLLSATLHAHLVMRRSGYHALVRNIRHGLFIRLASLVLLILAAGFESFFLMMFAAVCSGIFVSEYWSAFFELHDCYTTAEERSKKVGFWWFLEKIGGCILPIVAVQVVLVAGVSAALFVACSGTVLSWLVAKSLPEVEVHVTNFPHDPRTSLVNRLTKILALGEGMVTASIILLVRLTTMTESIVWMWGISGLFALGLIVGLTALLAALTSCVITILGGEEKQTALVNLSLPVVAIGCLAMFLSNQSPMLWSSGYIAYTIGTNMVFPLTINNIRRRRHAYGLQTLAARESARFIGRLLAVIVVGTMWMLGASHFSYAIGMTGLILYTWAHARLNQIPVKPTDSCASAVAST